MRIGFRFMDGTLDWGWICGQVRLLRVEDTSGIVAVNVDTGELLAACVMDNWTCSSVQCHITIANPLAVRHGFIRRITDYVFTERDKKYIYGLVPSNNKKALKLNKHLGFTEKTRLHGTFGEGLDYVILELKRENCPYWIKPEAAKEIEHGQA